jgi:uncharacterized protein (TIGR03437 family)
MWGSIRGYLIVNRIAPILPLTAGAQNGKPYISGYLVRVRNGVTTIESAAALLSIGIYGMSIQMDPDHDELYLILLGTGLRNRTSLQNARALIGPLEVPVDYIGPQSEVAGIDQVNVKLPRSLAGSGIALLQIAVDGVPNNFFYLEFMRPN